MSIRKTLKKSSNNFCLKIGNIFNDSETKIKKKKNEYHVISICAYLLKKVCSRNLIEFTLVDDLHCDLLTGENMPGELYYGEMTTAKRLLQVVEAGNLAIVVAVPHPPMHLVSLK